MGAVSYTWKYWNKVQLGYGGGLISLKKLKEGMAKLRLGSSVVQETKIWYVWDFNLFKMLK